MSFFDQFLTQPIFNLLAIIFNFVGDFGLSIIIMTILIRLALWPLIKKQLHQAKVMREIQPELKRIKKQANGNKLLESTMMMELYREKNIKAFSSLFIVIIQLPIMIAIFRVIQIFSGAQYNNINGTNPAEFIYPFMEQFGRIPDLLTGNHLSLFGLDLTKSAAVYFPALILAILASALQYYQSKQLLPNTKNSRKLRDMFRDAANGVEVDQSDMMAATNRNMVLFMPFMMFFISFALPAAVVLYYSVTSLIAVFQQHYILNRSEDEMEKLAEISSAKKKKTKISNRESKATEAIVVKKKDLKKKSTTASGQTVVRRIKAK